jgi:small subunit ribosomal protein S19
MARSLKKGFFVDPGLWKKIVKAQETDDRRPIKTWSRRSQITPEFVGLNIEIHNGKGFVPCT